MNKTIKTNKEIFSEAFQNYKKNDFKNAEALCNKILNIDPNHFDSILLLSNIYAIKKNFDQARKFLHRGFSIQPQNTSILNNLESSKTCFKYFLVYYYYYYYYFSI